MPAPQSLKNHTRFYPPFHFVIMPVLVANLIIAITTTVRSWPFDSHIHIWWIVMSFILILIAGNGRISAMKVQDRVIRLEERLHLTAVLPASDRALIDRLTTDQLIALRFASDSEVVALAHKAVNENLDRKAIKQSITTWRPDNDRV